MARSLTLATLATVVVSCVLASPAGTAPPAGTGEVIVGLRASGACSGTAAALTTAGARLVDGPLRLWALDASTAARMLPSLREAGRIDVVQPVVEYDGAAVGALATDPLYADEWWRAEVGIEGLTPPGPGIPVTIVDSGVDFTHPEFAGRPDLLALNEQEPQPVGGEHGTAVASVVGAPVNGAGLVGIYPEAALRSWDAAKGQGTRLDTIEIVNGILAAARAGRGVVNLSLGADSKDLAIELAVSEAVSLGTLVVAASGNDGDAGNPLGYPASLPHVVTVGATDRTGAVAPFSSRSNYVDVVAPGDDIPVASALGRNWRASSGTSFASPIVAGAAAWLWTVRPELDAGQVAEVIRRSARDIGAPGRDNESGFGIVDVARALAYPTPIPDPGEPNDDTDEVDPAGERVFSTYGPLTTKSKRRAAVSARVDRYEDPRDVYRVWLPARRTVSVSITATTDADLALYRSGTPTVVGRFAADTRLALGRLRGRTDRLSFANGATGRWAYLAVNLPKGVVDATYRLTVSAPA